MAALTWNKVNSYRWNCKELPGVCISAAKVKGDPVYTLWQGNDAVYRSLIARDCKDAALKLRK